MASGSSFACELTILEARNISEPPHKGSSSSLFVRFYLSSGNTNDSQKIQLNTRELPSPSCSWNEMFSLECNGTEDSLADMKEKTSIVLELRRRTRRRRAAFLGGGLTSSQVLGRAKVPWRTVFEAENMELERWVDCDEAAKAPSIRVAVKISRFPSTSKTMEGRRTRRRSERLKRTSGQYECGCVECEDIHTCEEYYDVFAVAAVLEAF